MNYQGVLRVIGTYFFFLAAIIGVGLGVSIYFQQFVPAQQHLQEHPTMAFATTFFICLLTGIILRFLTGNADKELLLREAILSVLSIWIVTIVITALPFRFSGVLNNMVDACFETASGLTTTGSTILHAKQYNLTGQEIPIHKVLHGFQEIQYTYYGTVVPLKDEITGAVIATGIEALPQALLFWRAFTQYVGGLGMVLLLVALLPALGEKGRILFRYESTGPSFSPLFPQVRKTSLVLMSIYTALNLVCMVFLLMTNKNLSCFEAMNISFATVSTGGFCSKNASLAGYNCLATDIVVMVFMVLGSLNFALYYDLIKGRLYKFFEPDVLIFLFLLLASSLWASVNLWGTPKHYLPPSSESMLSDSSIYSFPESIRYGFFQVISCISTTGFATQNYDLWPFFTQAILLVVMYLGGMSGSTAGGIKSIRICILWQTARKTIQSLFNRNEIQIIRVGDRQIDRETITGVLCFFLIFVLASLAGVLFLIYLGVDLETALGLNACMINNTGFSFRMAGPTESCAFLSVFSKLVCIAWMLIGRLELYVWFALFLPSFWRTR